MHPNATFRSNDPARTTEVARARGFGLLTVNDDPVPLISHIPFLMSEDGGTAHLHLVRSNPIARKLKNGALPARIAASGPDGYVSPDWYGVADQVPTWNYVAVHLTGRLSLLPDSELCDIIDAQSAHFERMLAPKPEWTSAKMTPEVLARMMRQIVPCRFDVAEADATRKLNQNKPDEVRLRAADAMEATGIGQETAALARLMREAVEA